MALLKSKISEIPEGAVILSESDALKHQMDVIKNWPKSSDILALKYGPYILGAVSFMSGAFFNNHFRRKFLLGRYGTVSSYLPVCFMPSLLSAVLHSEVVLRNIILMKQGDCPICLETRAAVLQASIGVLFPLVVAPVGCAALAVRFGSYAVPLIHEQPREALNMFKKMFSKIQTKTLYLFLGQAFLASVITHYEASNLFNITRKLDQYNYHQELR